jgi:hypothetical protein
MIPRHYERKADSVDPTPINKDLTRTLSSDCSGTMFIDTDGKVWAIGGKNGYRFAYDINYQDGNIGVFGQSDTTTRFAYYTLRHIHTVDPGPDMKVALGKTNSAILDGNGDVWLAGLKDPGGGDMYGGVNYPDMGGVAALKYIKLTHLPKDRGRVVDIEFSDLAFHVVFENGTIQSYGSNYGMKGSWPTYLRLGVGIKKLITSPSRYMRNTKVIGRDVGPAGNQYSSIGQRNFFIGTDDNLYVAGADNANNNGTTQGPRGGGYSGSVSERRWGPAIQITPIAEEGWTYQKTGMKMSFSKSLGWALVVIRGETTYQGQGWTYYDNINTMITPDYFWIKRPDTGEFIPVNGLTYLNRGLQTMKQLWNYEPVYSLNFTGNMYQDLYEGDGPEEPLDLYVRYKPAGATKIGHLYQRPNETSLVVMDFYKQNIRPADIFIYVRNDNNYGNRVVKPTNLQVSLNPTGSSIEIPGSDTGRSGLFYSCQLEWLQGQYGLSGRVYDIYDSSFDPDPIPAVYPCNISPWYSEVSVKVGSSIDVRQLFTYGSPDVGGWWGFGNTASATFRNTYVDCDHIGINNVRIKGLAAGTTTVSPTISDSRTRRIHFTAYITVNVIP